MGDRSLRDGAGGGSPWNTSQAYSHSTRSPQPPSHATHSPQPLGNIGLGGHTPNTYFDTSADTGMQSATATTIPDEGGTTAGGTAATGESPNAPLIDDDEASYDGFVGGLRYYRDLFTAMPRDVCEFVYDLPEDTIDFFQDLPENLKEFVFDDLFSGEMNHRHFTDRENGARRKTETDQKVEKKGKKPVEKIVTDVERPSPEAADESYNVAPPPAPLFGANQAWTLHHTEKKELCACLREVKPHYKYCRFCGRKPPFQHDSDHYNERKRKDVCCDCGRPMKQKAKFCHKCGAAQDPDDEEKIQEHYKQWHNKKAENDKKVPYFIVIWPTIVFGMWFFGAYANSQKEINQGKSFAELEGGLDTIHPGSTIMEIHRECDDLRLGFLFYRSWLYQCTHLSFTHVMGNCLVTWFLGIGLERLHGTSAMCVFFFCGVIGGAAFFSFSDAHRVVAGMSGGVYSVLGMRIGNLALNWGEKRQPCLELLLIMFWLGWEGIHYYHLVVEEGKRSQFSWSTHIGGMYTGGLILFLFGHNAVKKRWETHLRHCAWPGLVAVPVFAICWSIPWPPRTIFHTTPWCWKKLVYNRTAFNDRAWHCVNCGNADDSNCISEWSTNLYTETVTLDNCQDMYGWGYEELGDPQWNVSSVAP